MRSVTRVRDRRTKASSIIIRERVRCRWTDEIVPLSLLLPQLPLIGLLFSFANGFTSVNVVPRISRKLAC